MSEEKFKGLDSVVAVEKVGRWQSFVDSFKPVDAEQFEGTDLERAVHNTANSHLKHKLKNRHIQMIAIGGAIGTGLFVGSGGSLNTGGPAALILGFGIIGIMLFCTIHALGELAVTFPISGAFSTYSTRFIDPAWGFAMGWNYALEWIVVVPVELVAASITIGYWNSTINPDAWVAIFFVVIAAINLFGVRGYGEAEFVFSIIKVAAVIGFILLGLVLDVGGGPSHEYIGNRYWNNPGALANGFKGVCSVFINAAFSYSGTELVGLAAAETENPRKALPRACKQVFWRILLFYIIALTFVGLLVPYTDKQLLGASSVDITASPFVLAINNAGIKVLPSIINVVILISVMSVGNSAVYGSSRTMAALAEQGFAPKIFGYIDRAGRPLVSIIITLAIGLLCFLAGTKQQGIVFDWFMAISALCVLFTWASICFCHIRFRRALKVQGRSTDELAFTSLVGVWGSWFGVIINVLIIIAQFWIALFPIGGEPNANSFFMAYISVPLVAACFIFWKLFKRTKFLRAHEIDVMTGRRELDLDLLQQELAEEKAYIAQKNIFYRTYRFWC